MVSAITKQPRITTRDRQAAISKLCARLRQIKADLLHPRQEKTAESLYHAWIGVERRKVLSQRPLQKDNFHYDIQCSPQDYLPHMLYMMKAVEARGGTVYNACPLRSSSIPKHFRLHTQSLIELCLTKKQDKRRDFNADGNLVRRQVEIWGLFCRTDKRCFHMGDKDGHAHRFDHQIETDGVSCSILLKRRDKVGERVREPKAEKGSSDIYIDEVKDYAPLKNKGVVGIDPNMRDLLHCVDSDKKEQTKFRYTQDTRRKETKVKKYRNDLQQRKQEEEVDGKSVVEWEAELSDYNWKTMNLANFCEYIHKKNAFNVRLAPFYKWHIFRKLQLGKYGLYARRRRPVCWHGSRSCSVGQRRPSSRSATSHNAGTANTNEPVKGKGFRTLFRKAGYGVYLVDEFRTSCRCSASACHGECKTFRLCKNPRPYRAGYVLRHGLVKCTTCSRLWNRDTNAAASNIWKIAMCAIRGEPRPDDLERGGPR